MSPNWTYGLTAWLTH